ncbi:MAG: VOC family protein [Acidimicrobiia bacterium]|nr:VOC family protein [Acidimicrobiia bacterium]
MAVQLNHTIVHARDAEASARWLAEVLGLDPPERFGPFWQVRTSNGVDLDFDTEPGGADADIRQAHYAFLISEAEFDTIFARIVDGGIDHWADPAASRPGEINHNDGGRGVYFQDPDGHFMEIITRPYGSGSP